MLKRRLDEQTAEAESRVELESLGRRLTALEQDPEWHRVVVFPQACSAIRFGQLNPETPLRVRLLGERHQVEQLYEEELSKPDGCEWRELSELPDRFDAITDPAELSNVTWSWWPTDRPWGRPPLRACIDADDVTFPTFQGLAAGCLVSFGHRAHERPFIFNRSGGFPFFSHAAIVSSTISWGSAWLLRFE